MRLQYLRVHNWRHFDDVEFVVPNDAPVICLIGANGTGKSQVLEIIATCAQYIGISSGSEATRGNPFSERINLEARFFVNEGIIDCIDNVDFFDKPLQQSYLLWDRTITLKNSPNTGVTITAGGVMDPQSSQLASAIVEKISNSPSIHYLSLDADRAYPKIEIPDHQVSEIYRRDWESTNKQSNHRITRNLYEEWFRYLIGLENQANNRHIQSIRKARDNGESEPLFIDQFDEYKSSLRQVLPHLLFMGVDTRSRQITFDSAGTALNFDRLSGGEREIAFLIGQIDRFGLKKGLLLVDEPELHLNYDLLRSWIAYLKSSVHDGQIWLATHSLEAVEVTGQNSTFLLERNSETRKTSSSQTVGDQPLIATLSRSIGSPAFSISNLSFIFIEGESEIGERERFRLLCSEPTNVRFIEAGSCGHVINRIETLRSIAAEVNQPIRLGGVVDKDWRSSAEKAALEQRGIFVLGVHEIENLFLYPPTLSKLMTALGDDPDRYNELLIELVDATAARWIFDAARTHRSFRDYPQPSAQMRRLTSSSKWADFSESNEISTKIACLHGDLDDTQQALLKQHIIANIELYSRKRTENDLWRHCFGKEVFRSLMTRIGISSRSAGERAILSIWKQYPEEIPCELRQLRNYITGI